MKRLTRMMAALLFLALGTASAYAQLTVQGEAKSLVGIEVHFRFDKSYFDINYMGNNASLDRFAHVVDSIGEHFIDSVVIVSQSSPEGVYEHNVKLSRRRAATMRNVIEQRHPELRSRLRVHPDGESWAQLREYVKNDTRMKQTTIDKVLSIIDDNTISIGTKKWRMEQLPVYRYLIQTYYPRIRNSVFCIIYYDVPAEMVAIEEALPVITETQAVEVLPTYPVQLQAPREPVLNVRTNLLADLGTVLNVGIEYYPRHSRWTFLADWTFPWWSHDPSHFYLQMLNGSLEARRYFRHDDTHTGHYLSAYAHGNLYDFSFDAERAWQGEGAGLGLGYGYVWHPWKNERWKLEAFIRVGYYQSLYDPYHASDPYNGKYYYDWEGRVEDFLRRNHRLRWFGPSSLGVTISYDLFKRKLKIKN